MSSGDLRIGVASYPGRILVTGSGGFIGGYCVQFLRERHHEVFEIRNRLDCDLRDLASVANRLRNLRPDAVIHLAASPDHRGCNHLGSDEINNTVLCTHNLLNVLPPEHPCVIVHVGSYKQYGRGSIPFQENDVPQPWTPYGVAKQISEDLLSSRIGDQFRTVRLRLGPVYGPNEPAHRLVSRIIAAIASSDVLTLAPDNIVWDGVFVADAVEAIYRSITTPRACGQTINVSGGDPRTPREVLNIVEALMERRASAVEYVDSPLWQPLAGNVHRAKEVFGWTPSTLIMQGLSQCIAQRINTRAAARA